MTNIFKNGRMVSVASSKEEEGLQWDFLVERLTEKLIIPPLDYNKVVRLVNSMLDQNETEGKIVINGNAQDAKEVPRMAKVAKYALEGMGYKVKITVGNDKAGRKNFRDTWMYAGRAPGCEYKERFVTYNK